MSQSGLTLEDFEEQRSSEDIVHPEFHRGYQEGQEAERSSIAAEHRLALSNIEATLSDISFGYAEAHAAIMKSLQPLLLEIANAIIPLVLKESFGQHLLDVLNESFELRSGSPILVNVSTQI
ncbi:MAG: hypothetical protein AAF709_11170, partial [Pseudomonadota bacterium]